MNALIHILVSLLEIVVIILRKLYALLREVTADWHIYIEETVPGEELTESREAASFPQISFFLLLFCAAIIATLGLISNSAAAIIGAMIVAPLMNPILSAAFAIVTLNWTLYKRSLITVFLGATVAILSAQFICKLIPINVVGSEIIARGSPSSIDLGIAIAAGVAGSFALTRSSIASSIAGVAIAVALVPPLCVVGVGLGIGGDLSTDIAGLTLSSTELSWGAFLLFFTNLAGIIVSACIVFLTQKYGNPIRSLPTIFLWLLVVAILYSSLSNSFQEFIISNRVRSVIHEIRKENPEVTRDTLTSYRYVRVEDDTVYITVLVNVPQSLRESDDFKRHISYSIRRISDAVSDMGIKAVEIDLRVTPIEVINYRTTL